MKTIKSRNKSIKRLLEDMVLISSENKEVIIQDNKDPDDGKKIEGFCIETFNNTAGFIEKEDWKNIEKFQNLKLDLPKHSDIMLKVVKEYDKITSEDIKEYPEIKKWIDMGKEDENFKNSVAEIDLLYSIGEHGEEAYLCTAVLAGRKCFERINIEFE